MYPIGPVIPLYEQDSHQVGVGLIGVKVCPGIESPCLQHNLGTFVFFVKDVQVTPGKEEQVNQFQGNPKGQEGVGQRKRIRRGK